MYQQFLTIRKPFFDGFHQIVAEVLLVGAKRLLIEEPFDFQVVEVDLVSGDVCQDDLHLFRQESFLRSYSVELQSKTQNLEIKCVFEKWNYKKND